VKIESQTLQHQPPTTSITKKIMDFPLEITIMIAEFLGNLGNVVRLASTCTTLRALLLSHDHLTHIIAAQAIPRLRARLGSELCEQIYQTGALVSGSLILQAIYDEQYPGSDIDIFGRAIEINISHYTPDHGLERHFAQEGFGHCPTDIYNHIPNLAGHVYVHRQGHQTKSFDFVRTLIDPAEFVKTSFDIDVVKNTFNGRTLTLGFIDDLITKTTRMHIIPYVGDDDSVGHRVAMANRAKGYTLGNAHLGEVAKLLRGASPAETQILIQAQARINKYKMRGFKFSEVIWCEDL
jgi:hypothetical protein